MNESHHHFGIDRYILSGAYLNLTSFIIKRRYGTPVLNFNGAENRLSQRRI